MFGTIKAHGIWAQLRSGPLFIGEAQKAQQLKEVAEAFEMAHELGMATILWCYTRNNAFKVDGVDYHTSADLTGQANHLGRDATGRYYQTKIANE